MLALQLGKSTKYVTLVRGGRLLVGDEDHPRLWVTVTTIFNYGGARYIMTCGHAAGPYILSGETRGVVGQLVVNLLRKDDAVDVAVYRVTDSKARVLRPVDHADYTDYAQVGEARVYTAHGRRSVHISAVDSTPAHMMAKLGKSPLIACAVCTVRGDSGAPLQQRDAQGNEVLVGLHGGNDYQHSYFTPIRPVMDRLLTAL